MTNDYLTGLAKRTLGLLPVAQPLITPSFASVPLKKNERPEITFDEYDKTKYQEVTGGNPPDGRQQIFSTKRSISHQTTPSKDDSFFMEHPVLVKTFVFPGKNTRNRQNPDNNLIETKMVSEQELSEQKSPETEIKNLGTSQKEHISSEVLEKMDMPSEPKNHQKVSDEDIGKTVFDKKHYGFSIPRPKMQNSSQAKHDPSLTSEYDVTGKFEKVTENESQRANLTSPLSVLKLKRIADTTSDKNEPRQIFSDKKENENLISPVIKRYEEPKNFKGQKDLTQIDFASMNERSTLPTVKVTIGRVEVRAVATPQFLRPPVIRKNPKISLDEYLKQHNG